MQSDSSSNILLTRRIIDQDALNRLARAHGRFVDQRRDGRRIIMQNCVLIGLDFKDMCFARAHFLGCHFAGASLVNADFTRAKLFASSFEGCDLTRAVFERADLRAVAFDKAILNETRLDQADLRKGGIISAGNERGSEVFREISSSFRNADLNRTNLRDALLKDVDFTGALLEATDLHGADLRGTRFTGAELNGVALTNVRLHEADMRGASFENMAPELSGVLSTPIHPINAVKLGQALRNHEIWVSSGSARGTRADFSEQNLSGMNLAGRSLATISFAKANLKGIDFKGAVLAACDFTDANLRGADLTGSDLRGAQFTGAHLDSALLGQIRTGVLAETGMRTTFPNGFNPQNASLH
jgi:uncharacterized protein YjbI with pentapeptide repeats